MSQPPRRRNNSGNSSASFALPSVLSCVLEDIQCVRLRLSGCVAPHFLSQLLAPLYHFDSVFPLCFLVCALCLYFLCFKIVVGYRYTPTDRDNATNKTPALIPFSCVCRPPRAVLAILQLSAWVRTRWRITLIRGIPQPRHALLRFCRAASTSSWSVMLSFVNRSNSVSTFPGPSSQPRPRV